MLCVALGFVPSSAFGDWADFLPRSFERGAFLDVSTSFERDHIRDATQSTRWTDTFIREKLTLFSNGYSYHPRFLQYQLSVSGLARQENYDSSFSVAPGWRLGSGLEYDAQLFFLPEHPYNLTLFYRRYEPLFKEQAATQHGNVATNRGASFRYRQKPYFLHASYVNDTIESAVSSSDVTRFGVEGEYFKRFQSGNELSFTGGVNPAWFSTSEGLEGSSTDYTVANFLNVQRVPAWAVPVRLSSSLGKNTFTQENRTAAAERFSNDQLVWYELLNANLPWNFRTDLSYRRQDNDSTIPDGDTASTRTLSDRGQNVRFDFIHRLYQSLDTTYTLLRDSRTATGGETASLSQSLAVNYAKLIPWGTLMAGLSLSTAEMDNRGHAEVLNELHRAILVPGGSFTLGQQSVDRASLRVYLTCASEPCPPDLLLGTTKQLAEGQYVVTPALNTFEITLVSLPLPFGPGTYDFLVSYSFVAGDFGLQSDAFGGNVSVELFDDLLTPYFNYSTVRSEVSYGTFPGSPIDATTYATGLMVRRGPLRMRGEYQKVEWAFSPYRTVRAEVQYVHSLNPTTSIYATAGYVNQHYFVGTSGSYTTAFTEETESVSGSIQKQLFSRELYLSAGGSYSRMQGPVDANAYSLNTALTWKIGKLDLTLGASGYESDSQGSTTLSTRRDHQFAYLNMRRRLF